jgi:YfiR/HmsC-like
MRRTCLPGFAPVAHATFVILFMLLPMARFVVRAQDVTASALKAAYIYNFVRFTVWPEDLPASEPFVMCVLGDGAVGDALGRAVTGRALAGHRIVVSMLAAPGPKGACRVLYVSSMMPSQAEKLVAELRDAPVLTISDIEGFTEVGGIAQFFFEDGQLRFTIRPESAKRARLLISSRLLALSRR